MITISKVKAKLNGQEYEFKTYADMENFFNKKKYLGEYVYYKMYSESDTLETAGIHRAGDLSRDEIYTYV